MLHGDLEDQSGFKVLDHLPFQKLLGPSQKGDGEETRTGYMKSHPMDLERFNGIKAELDRWETLAKSPV